MKIVSTYSRAQWEDMDNESDPPKKRVTPMYDCHLTVEIRFNALDVEGIKLTETQIIKDIQAIIEEEY